MTLERMRASGESFQCNSYIASFSTYSRYIAYPELMETLIVYLRREAQRLERIPDEAILGPRVVGREGEGVRELMWGKVKP